VRAVANRPYDHNAVPQPTRRATGDGRPYNVKTLHTRAVDFNILPT